MAGHAVAQKPAAPPTQRYAPPQGAYYAPGSAPAPYQQPRPRYEPIQPYDSEGRPNPDAFEWTGFALGVKVGTLGIGADASIYLDDWVNFRANAGYLQFTYKDTIDDIDFDFDTEFLTGIFVLDFYPFADNNFRFSGGVALLNNTMDVSGTPRGTEEIGDTEYTAAQIGTISGSVDFDPVAPYIGIGYGNPVTPDTAVSFIFDFGVIFQTYETKLTSNGTAANDPGFQEDLASLEKDIEDELDKVKIYPVINFGVAYHF